MFRQKFAVVGVILAAGSLGACSASDPAPPHGESEQGIYGGVADTQNTAVMALVNVAGTACSGTTIAVKPPYGYLLTAAHCVVAVDAQGRVITPLQPTAADDLLVVPGADWLADANASTYYPVQEARYHASYNGVVSSPNDIAIVRYIGATASTPVIPAMTAAEDDLAVGTALTFVGYGVTQTDPMNTRRFRVDDTIASLTAAAVTHNKADGTGFCSGDSGGPAIRTLAAGKRVAAVSSYSTGANCATGTGTSVRVSAQASFIQQYLTPAPPAVSCVKCRELSGTTFGGCTTESRSCASGTPCASFLTCATACATTDTACLQRCNTQFAQGAADYSRFNDCACMDCSTECAGQPACDAPACGLEFADAACNACNEMNCCAETTACANDAACRTCGTSSTPAASCDTNTLLRAFRTCNLERCGQACGAACGFNNPGACGQCLNGSCCAQARTCALDSACNSCATGSGTPQSCGQNPGYVALFNCLGACAGDPCGAGAGTGGTSGTGGTAGGSAGAGASAGDMGGGGVTGGTGAASGTGASAGAAGTGASAGTLGANDRKGKDSGGCGCRMPRGDGDRTTAVLALLALGIGFARRRRHHHL
jgi:MYXO-CTERM domain-containing protein